MALEDGDPCLLDIMVCWVAGQWYPGVISGCYAGLCRIFRPPAKPEASSALMSDRQAVFYHHQLYN